MRMVVVENHIAISTVEFTNIFFWDRCLCITIYAPYLINLIFLVKQAGYINTHWWRNGNNSADQTSNFPPSSSNGGTSSITGALLLAPLTPAPCCFSKAVKMRELRTTGTKQHYTSQVEKKFTCYFSSSLFRGRCRSWWPRVKVGLEWICFIALNKSGYMCWLGSILTGKKFLWIYLVN